AGGRRGGRGRLPSTQDGRERTAGLVRAPSVTQGGTQTTSSDRAGTQPETTVPRPRVELASNTPPTASTRSRQSWMSAPRANRVGSTPGPSSTTENAS